MARTSFRSEGTPLPPPPDGPMPAPYRPPSELRKRQVEDGPHILQISRHAVPRSLGCPMPAPCRPSLEPRKHSGRVDGSFHSAATTVLLPPTFSRPMPAPCRPPSELRKRHRSSRWPAHPSDHQACRCLRTWVAPCLHRAVSFRAAKASSFE